MDYIGHIKDLQTTYATPINYQLVIGEEKIPLNNLLNKELRITFLHEIRCIECGRITKKSFNNGFCYPCFQKLPQNDLCFVKPHTCHYHLGTCRDNSFAENYCNTPHYVYLSFTNELKVGITQKERLKFRWIDQGAIKALPIALVPDRKTAGELEFFLSKYIPDKTNWRKMLLGEFSEIDFLAKVAEIKQIIPEGYQPYILTESMFSEFIYPQSEQILKVNSLSFAKDDIIEGKLIGIKGQYLILVNGVFSLKKHLGYKVNFKVM